MSNHKTAHQLARELLAGPDLPIWHFDPSRAGIDDELDTSLSIPEVQVTDPTDGLTAEEIQENKDAGCYTGKFITICGDSDDEGEAITVRELQSRECPDLARLKAENPVLRKALGDLVDAVNVEMPGGMNIGGKTGVALIRAVDALAEKLDVAAIIEAQKHNHEKTLHLD